MSADDEGATAPAATSDTTVHLSGPTEPIVDDEGAKLLYMTQTGEPSITDLGTWVCLACGTETAITEGDPETPPNQCSGCENAGPFRHKGVGADDEATVQAAARADTMWHPPSTITDEGYSELWEDVREYIRDHWDAGDGDEAAAVYEGLTAYALSSWVRENLTFLPHLMLRGHTTGGKTRLLNTLARVSYRAIVSASATPASMYRLVDAYNVSYFVSEYHGLDYDTQLELDNVIRAGQKRGEVVTRAESTQNGHEPRVFDPFSHVAVATQFEPDDDIINRCIQVKSSTSKRDMPPVLDEGRAESIRDRLIYARYRLLDSAEWDRAESEAYSYLAERDIDGRTREKLLSGVTMAILWDRLEEFGEFVDIVRRQDRTASADSEDALFIETLSELAFDRVADASLGGDGDPFAALEIPYGEIATRYEDITGVEKSASWVGHVRSRLGFEKKRTRNGTTVHDAELGEKLREHCDRFNLEWGRLEGDRIVAVDEGESHRAMCPDCGNKEWLDYRDVVTEEQVCVDCAEIRRDEERDSAGDE